MTSSNDRFICLQDVFDIGSLTMTFCLGLLTPKKHWSRLAEVLARMHLRLRYPEKERVDHARSVFERIGTEIGIDSTECFFEKRVKNTYLETLFLTELLIGIRREPHVELVGREHISHALERGRGGILWCSGSTCSDFITKMAIRQAGFSLSHLSRYRHGSSGSVVGEQVITRARATVENRYLEERLVLRPEDNITALKTLQRRLRKNGLVSVTAISGEHNLPCPCFGGHIDYAIGAPRLAVTTGASLIPLWTKLSDHQHFCVEASEPLRVPENAGRAEAEHELMRQYGVLLEHYLRDFALQWRGWGDWSSERHSTIKR